MVIRATSAGEWFLTAWSSVAVQARLALGAYNASPNRPGSRFARSCGCDLLDALRGVVIDQGAHRVEVTGQSLLTEP